MDEVLYQEVNCVIEHTRILQRGRMGQKKEASFGAKHVQNGCVGSNAKRSQKWILWETMHGFKT